MKLSDYKKASRDCWTAKKPIATKIGPFAVDLSGIPKGKPPSDEMLKRANQFIKFALANVDAIHDKLFKQYRAGSRDTQGKEWFEFCGLPTNLDRAGILEYLEDATLTVDFNPD